MEDAGKTRETLLKELTELRKRVSELEDSKPGGDGGAGGAEKSLEACLARTSKMESVGKLAEGMAHDFKNIMVAVGGLTRLGKNKTEPDNPLYSYFDNIQKATERAIELTRRLSFIGHRRPAMLIAANLNELVEALVNLFSPSLGDAVTVSTDLAPGLPTVLADTSAIERVIMNLVVNARDAIEGGGKITLKTHCVCLGGDDARTDNTEARPGTFVRLTVTDTGSGMDDATLRSVFEPFFTTKKRTNGTGLGLSVVYGIVKSHRGWVDVESKPGEGSSFSVFLPVTEEQDGTTREIPIDPIKGRLSPEYRGGGERVLLVDDDEVVRKVTTLILDRNGYRVFSAPDPDKALKLFDDDNEGFSLALIDVVLPDRNGFELAEEMADLKPAMPIVLMSGYAYYKTQMGSLDKGPFYFIEKPYEAADLLRTVKDIIKAHAAHPPSPPSPHSPPSPPSPHSPRSND